eukprot:TRINITY_DN4676_c0_g1_i19.p1 TRINITY_DN4676_c0_g1~~TRINITY_DN4676_c0_g1_i19.p1  ORF type:complete len:410 (-),score=87.88 TRINITY_DN4676_c0_g1_i19:925-2004(-)
MYYQNESKDSLVAWQEKHDLLIDRYDVRSHLDFIVEYDKRRNLPPELSETEQEDEIVRFFERYRDLVVASQTSMTEEEVIKLVELEWEKLIQQPPKPKPTPATAAAATAAPYSSVGFQYPENEAKKDSSDSDESGDDDEDESGSEDEKGVAIDEPTNAVEHRILDMDDTGQKTVDSAALTFGIPTFCRFLRRFLYEEEVRQAEIASRKDLEDRIQHLNKRERQKEREKARIEARGPIRHVSPPRRRRSSPSYEPYRDGPRSPSPDRSSVKTNETNLDNSPHEDSILLILMIVVFLQHNTNFYIIHLKYSLFIIFFLQAFLRSFFCGCCDEINDVDFHFTAWIGFGILDKKGVHHILFHF